MIWTPSDGEENSKLFVRKCNTPDDFLDLATFALRWWIKRGFAPIRAIHFEPNVDFSGQGPEWLLVVRLI
jgi:hypothetical protein